jgi:hypothetical protein
MKFNRTFENCCTRCRARYHSGSYLLYDSVSEKSQDNKEQTVICSERRRASGTMSERHVSWKNEEPEMSQINAGNSLCVHHQLPLMWVRDQRLPTLCAT